MNKVLLVLCIVCCVCGIGNAQVSKLNKQKVIKGMITLSTGEIIKVGDVFYFDKNREKGKNFEYVFVDEYGGNPRLASKRSVFKKQKITHFKELDGVYYAYTSGNNIVAIEEALKAGEVTGKFTRSSGDAVRPIVTSGKVESSVKQEKGSFAIQLKESNVKSVTYPLRSLVMLDLEPIDIETLKNDKSVFEMYHMRYCLRKYHKNRRLARDLMFGGMACGIVGGVFYEDDFGKGLMYAGGGLGVASFVVYIVSEKWLKYSTIKPVLKGDQVGIMINF